MAIVYSTEQDVERMSSEITLKRLTKCSTEEFAQIKEYFTTSIAPIYGDQTNMLEKIFESSDRYTDLLYYKDKFAGILIYKSLLSNESMGTTFPEGLELKTLLLFESNPKSAGVLFTALLKRAAAKAIEMNAACVFATVSSLKKNVLKLMKRYGYKVKKVVKDKYVVGVNEYLICHSNPHALFNDTNTYIASILPCGY